jgi:hypothetical protein
MRQVLSLLALLVHQVLSLLALLVQKHGERADASAFCTFAPVKQVN